MEKCLIEIELTADEQATYQKLNLERAMIRDIKLLAM